MRTRTRTRRLLLSQRFRTFWSEFKWKGLFQFLLTGIFRIISGGGQRILGRIFKQKSTLPFLTNWFFALIRKFGKIWFHFPQVFPLISDRSFLHNGKHGPLFTSNNILIIITQTKISNKIVVLAVCSPPFLLKDRNHPLFSS